MNQPRASILHSFGASPTEVEELLAYNDNVFEQCRLPFTFPLEFEAHVSVWQEYAATARKIGVLEALKPVLVQLRFPIQEGISQTEAYRAATRRGLAASLPGATGLNLQKPEQLQLMLHQSLAGAVPVLLVGNRADFVSLVQALTMQNEPKPVPASMGACMIAGYNNWDRIRRYRQQWERQYPKASWAVEFKRLVPCHELYQDRFMIVSDGPYSNVAASDLGLSRLAWRRLSLMIRLEHECTHYLTCRLFNSMRNNLLDELIADYRGIVAATGRYRSDWFLSFLGLESSQYREGGRLQNYRGQPPLSDGAFRVLQALVRSAAANLERFDTEQANLLSTPCDQMLAVCAMCCLTLEELAASGAIAHLQNRICDWQKDIVWEKSDERYTAEGIKL